MLNYNEKLEDAMKYAISIDIGGTNTRVSLIDENYQVRGYESFKTDSQTPFNTLNQIKAVIKSFDKDVVGVGVSCPGPLDLKEGIILTPPNLPGWHGLQFTEEMTKLLGIPTYLENDANLACLAEAVLGAGKDLSYVQYLTISTGLGAGFVIDQEIYQGSSGFAQEVANVIVVPDGHAVGNLQPGSIESISSGTGIVSMAKAKGLDVEHAGIVNDLAQAGNKDAQDVMRDAKTYLANFIAAIYAFLDPEIVILGGSVALKIDGFVKDVENMVKEKVYPVVKPKVRVEKSTIGEDNGILGGAILAFRKGGIQ